LNTATYILEMFKKGKDVFDGGCKETFFEDDKSEKKINSKILGGKSKK